MDYQKEIDNLLTALDVIYKFESGDQRKLKSDIRNEIARLEQIVEKLEVLAE